MKGIRELYKREEDEVSEMEYDGFLDYTHSSVVVSMFGEELKKEEDKYQMPIEVDNVLDELVKEGYDNVYNVLDYLVLQRGIEEVTDWIFGDSKNMDVFVVNFIDRKNNQE